MTGVAGGRRAEAGAQERRAIQVDVEIAVRGRIHAAHALESAEGVRDLAGDGPGRLAQPAREFEGERQREVAEGPRGRHLDDECRELVTGEAVEAVEHRRNAGADGMVDRQDHCNMLEAREAAASGRPGRRMRANFG